MLTKPIAADNHQPNKIFESKSAVIFDNFLPEDVYHKIYAYVLKGDYEHINTKGKVRPVWNIHDGFPLRSMMNLFYHTDAERKPQGEGVYPSKTPFDLFVDHMLALQPQVEHVTGRQDEEWKRLSVTAWMYQTGTGLSMHDDGAGTYSGAYVYFLNPFWRAHWGGFLVIMDEEGNRLMHNSPGGRRPISALAVEHGFPQCVFPKKNRLVFIANGTYHMVTRVNEPAGDNIRTSLAGFFHRKK